jgi:hypothetical protein
VVRGGKYLPVHTMKAYGEVEVWLHRFLKSSWHGGQHSASRSAVLSLGEYVYTLKRCLDGHFGKGRKVVSSWKSHYDVSVFQPVGCIKNNV